MKQKYYLFFILVLIHFLAIPSYGQERVKVVRKSIDNCAKLGSKIKSCSNLNCTIQVLENAEEVIYSFRTVKKKKQCTLDYTITRQGVPMQGSLSLKKTQSNNLIAFLNHFVSKPRFEYELDAGCCNPASNSQSFCDVRTASGSALYFFLQEGQAYRCFAQNQKPATNSAVMQASKNEKTGEVEQLSLKMNYDSSKATVVEFPAFMETSRLACNQVINKLESCPTTQCRNVDKAGGVVEFEFKKSPQGACEFREVQTSDPAIIQALAGLSTLEEAKVFAESNKSVVNCAVPAVYMKDFREYLKLKVNGGKASVSPCVITKSEQARDNANVGCTMTVGDKTFVDIPHFGEAKGFCQSNMSQFMPQ